MDQHRKKVLLASALGALVIIALVGAWMLSGPAHADTSSEALQAAARIVQEQGGGAQPTTPDGLPADAAQPPTGKPGRLESTRGRP